MKKIFSLPGFTLAGGRTYKGPIFDVQAHALKPGPAVDAFKAGIAVAPHVTEATKEIIYEIADAHGDDLEGQARLDALGEDGAQVITALMNLPLHLPGNVLIGIVNDVNVWMAEKTAANPQLIGTVSVAPPPVMADKGMANESLAACRSAIEDLGLKGIFLAAQYNGFFLGEPIFEPYFALVEELDVPVIIHPSIVAEVQDSIPRRNIPTLTGYLDDQRTSLLDLVKAGILEKYPDLTIIATHLGGGILSSLGRLEALAEHFPDEQWYIDLQGQEQLLPHSISYYVKKIYYDCNNAQVKDIRHAISVVGVDHLLTGTDFPWTPVDWQRDTLGKLLLPQVRKKIAYENAAALFGR